MGLGCTTLHIACGKADLKVVALLLDRGADVEVRCDKGTSPLDLLLKGLERGLADDRFMADDRFFRAEILLLLIDRGVDLDIYFTRGTFPDINAMDNLSYLLRGWEEEDPSRDRLLSFW